MLDSTDIAPGLDHDLLNANQRPIICIQGLGFVGAAMAVAVASARDPEGRPTYNVFGVDLPTAEGRTRVEALNRGEFPFETVDQKLRDSTQRMHEAANFVARTDATCFKLASVIIVDVPLDVLRDEAGPHLGMESFRGAIRTIGGQMRDDALVIVETTVPPGTTETIVAPILAEELARRNLPTKRFLLAHSYERVMPGAAYLDSIINMWRVYAGRDQRSADACERFLSSVINVDRYPLRRLSSTTASELAKTLENTFRAVTIALMDEWSSFSEKVGVDLFEVVDSIRVRETHRNMRTPGFGVGGYCLTKDPLMGELAARELFGFEHPFPFSSMAVDVNRDMPKRALQKLEADLGGSLAGRTLLLLGVSYREDVGDTRYSPSETFLDAACEKKARVLVHDPLVTFWRETSMPVLQEMPDAAEIDAIVLAVPHRHYRDFNFEHWLQGHTPMFFDTFDVLSADQRRRLRALGCRVECIGRGEGL